MGIMMNRESLLATATNISTCFEAEEIARVAAKRMGEIFEVETCLIYRWEQPTGSLALLSGVIPDNWGSIQELHRPFELDHTSLARLALEQGQPIQAHSGQPDFHAGLNGLAINIEVKSLLILPLVAK